MGKPLHKQLTLWLLFSICFTTCTFSQCPYNIDFEKGTFEGWECYAGKVDSLGNVKVNPGSPISRRHSINLTDLLDQYGDFPTHCPNGSGYSVMLGNDDIGAQAERVSYTFVIPAGQDAYSIIYNYAVVFENPDHLPYQQPRFTAKVFDVTSNTYIQCSSFDYAASSSLPGFKKVAGTKIFYKPWTPVTIKLTGYAGKTVRLEFTTNDCTKGGHFGYAYLDINEDCSSPIKGSIRCNGSASTILSAPYGFKEYHWYNATFSQLLGSGNVLKLDPSPATGTRYALEVIPYPGSGCVDTLYTTITSSPDPFVFKLPDSLGVCFPAAADITGSLVQQSSTPGLHYNYFLDSTQQEYLVNAAAIKDNGTYYIQASNAAGCFDIKPIAVIVSEAPNLSFADPVAVNYPGHIDITDPSLVKGDTQGITFTYWLDAAGTHPLPRSFSNKYCRHLFYQGNKQLWLLPGKCGESRNNTSSRTKYFFS
jgi:hypothetical protein